MLACSFSLQWPAPYSVGPYMTLSILSTMRTKPTVSSLRSGMPCTMYGSAANTRLEALVPLEEHMEPVMLAPSDAISSSVGLSASLAARTVSLKSSGQICRVPA